MTGDHFTILIFSKNSSNVRRYRIPKFIFKLLVVVLPVLITLAILLGLNYLNNPEHTELTTHLQEKNETQRQEIRLCSQEIAKLQNQIAEMNEFDSKLRVIANLENQPSSLFGVGGPFLEDRREKMLNQLGPDTPGQAEGSPSAAQVLETNPLEDDPQHVGDLTLRAASQLAHVPSVWPARGWLVADFGSRISPLTGHPQMYEGIGISNSVGTPVLAPAEGLVTTVGADPDHGKMIILSHGHGIVTRYGHLDQVGVEVGQKVRRGEMIGKMGNTGRSMGPHLYYEVRVNGIPVDPKNFL